MESRWSDAEAQKAIDRYAARSGEPLALRVYTSRLIGNDADLVLHRGGNTSVKIVKRNLLGEEVEALCVKGSGWDLDSIEPPRVSGHGPRLAAAPAEARCALRRGDGQPVPHPR